MSTLPDFPINPSEWRNSIQVSVFPLVAILKAPYWILVLLALFSKRMRRDADLTFYIFLFFCAFHILIPSLTGRYLYRYGWPMCVASFVPLGIVFGRAFRFAWPLLSLLVIPLGRMLLRVIGPLLEGLGWIPDDSVLENLFRTLMHIG